MEVEKQDIRPNAISFTIEKKIIQCKICWQEVVVGIEYRNEIYHRECFKCTNCSIHLAGRKFMNQDSEPFCLLCYEQLFAEKCNACKHPIFDLEDGFFISMEGLQWHVECFTCVNCKKTLLGELSVNMEKEIYCLLCAKHKTGT